MVITLSVAHNASDAAADKTAVIKTIFFIFHRAFILKF
jgi:hypothetical protein